tara:strand:- start:293 stop:643 length:351 start_codon:yes stop_codon:yes gene_type:complete
MKLLELTDQEILKVADPLWDDLIKTSNNKDYGGFTKNFSKQLLMGTDEVTLGKQWAGSEVLTSLSKERDFLGCLRRNEYVTVLYKQKSESVPGDFLGRLVLGIEGDEIKIYGATIF